ncbi:MAG: glycogen/starch/alpha-glucan phosphorylase [Ruminococcaceae bacterium]|nr:glycogen/starch/alpha-glucan phosphorylase [Oscillospiraceae bacterium]
MTATQLIKNYCGREISLCNDGEIYMAIVRTIREIGRQRRKKESGKKLYYISAEFLIGRLLTNNLINLGIYDEVKKLLSDNGKDIEKYEEMEAEPSLGNGGLGRLAACFLDSVATLDLCGDGVGINYHFGLFKQVFRDNLQKEEKNPWLLDSGFLEKDEKTYKVDFGDFSVLARLYNLDIVGYMGRVNKLRLFDIDTVDEKIVKEGIAFDKTDIEKNLTLFLYPDDSDDKGRLLRAYQQYFMVSAGAQLIIDECESRGCKLYDLYDYAVIQINDTHPSMIIPELIRLLTKKGLNVDDAIEVVRKSCAYTNHTILSEALEKWEIGFIKKVAPGIVPIIEILDDRVRRGFDDSLVSIIDNNEKIHMANMDIHYSKSVNGVAALHTEILKNTELNNFYRIYPDKFNNKTNGITFRRWLYQANPELTAFLKELIGDGFMKNANELEKLKKYKEDKGVLTRLIQIKNTKKVQLKEYIFKMQNREMLAESVFDMQIKRLHEYKRQQLNALYLIDKYFEIKEGEIPEAPITAVFGAKAAPAYTIAKDIIHLILCLEKIFLSDKEVSEHLKIVMVENYNVSYAEKLIPACDISEQISLASKEASGTGNMKFILNGGVILGTMDGANVEIYEKVGKENIYIFGDDSETVIKRYKDGSYKPSEFYENNKRIKRAVDFITDEKMMQIGNEICLSRLKNELINKDYFMTFPDFESYKNARDKAISDYNNKNEWAKKMLMNISGSGYFSSDRTIEEYNRDIWHLK